MATRQERGRRGARGNGEGCKHALQVVSVARNGEQRRQLKTPKKRWNTHQLIIALEVPQSEAAILHQLQV